MALGFVVPVKASRTENLKKHLPCIRKRGMSMKPKKGEFYRHFKGTVYQVLGIAKHSDPPHEEMVLYKSFKDEIVWVRPLEEFMGIHPEHQVIRFEKVRFGENADTGIVR
jgi:hypothetical protein